jgi:anti-sigma factor RsiW
MTMHLSEDQLHDYAGGELSPRERQSAAAHLDGCATCRARAEALLALTTRLAALPRTAEPAADGWCALHARLLAEAPAAAPAPSAATRVIPLDARRRRQPVPVWMQQAAAAALLLGLGFGGGRASHAVNAADAVLVAADTVATAMHAAVRVQLAGSEYVAAVAQFVAAAGRDSLVADQGREAAIAACYGATRELTRLPNDDSASIRLFRAASLMRPLSGPTRDTVAASGVGF